MKALPEYATLVKKMREERNKARKESRCVSPPFGCGQIVDVDNFRDELSRKEYGLSALCQNCQDKFFSTSEELENG